MTVVLIAMGIPAAAHDLAGELARAPLVSGGELVGSWTTSGLVTADETGWGRVCAESLPRTQSFAVAPDGAVLRATLDGVYRSDDGGCSFDAEPWLAEPVRFLVDAGPDLLIVAPREAGDALFVSTDGQPPVEVGPLPPSSEVRSLAVGGDGSWWIGAYDPLRAMFVARSPDRGDTWEPRTPPAAPYSVDHAVLGPAGDGVLIGTASLFGPDRLSTWVDETWVDLVEIPLYALGAACAGEHCFAATGEALLRWSAQGDPVATLALVDGPPACLVTTSDGALWGCRSRFEPTLLASTVDGETWVDALPLVDVHDRTCPAGTPGAELCPPPSPPQTAPEPTLDVAEGPVVSRPSGGCGGHR